MREEYLLNAEQLLDDLITELKKIKTAAEQLNEAKEIVSLVTSSTEKVSLDTAKILESASKILQKIEEAKIKEQYDLVQKEIEEFSAYAKKMLPVIESSTSTITNTLNDFSSDIKRNFEKSTKELSARLDNLESEVTKVIKDQTKALLARTDEIHSVQSNKFKKSLFIPFGIVIIIQIISLIILLAK
ncbi:MAG TPA: hypothetical protein ENF81_09795 [Thermotogaceae bacterium]|nr:hypothetical protein [Thermotogaceae bacterium]